MRFFIFLLIFPSLLYSQKKAPKCDAMDGLAINYFDEVPEAYTGAVKVCYQTGELSAHLTPVSYTHLTLPTTPYV